MNRKQENKNLDILQRVLQVASFYLGLPLLPQKRLLFLLLLLSLEVVLGGCRGVGTDLEELPRFPALPLLPWPLLLPLGADGDLTHLAGFATWGSRSSNSVDGPANHLISLNFSATLKGLHQAHSVTWRHRWVGTSAVLQFELFTKSCSRTFCSRCHFVASRHQAS